MKNNECPVHKEGGPVCICASELSRVRGLLQRIHGFFLWRVSPDSKGRHIVEDDVIRNVNKLCESGAESADIGKLSTFAEWYPEAMKVVERYAPGELGLGNALANLLTRVANGELVPSGAESGVEMGKVNRVPIIRVTQGGSTGCTQDAYDRIGKIVTTNSGSAETGGEKTEDESRKPEIFLSLHSNGGFFRDRRDMTIRLLADYKWLLERSPAALAESSLSSPPPLCKCGHSPAMHEATSGWTAGNSYLNCKVCPDCTRFKPASSPELLPKV